MRPAAKTPAARRRLRFAVFLSTCATASAMDCWNQGLKKNLIKKISSNMKNSIFLDSKFQTFRFRYGENYCCDTEKNGPRGNTECWDEFYTPELCCSNIGSNETGSGSGFGCEAHYFTGLKLFSGGFLTSGNLSLPGIMSWGVEQNILNS